MRALLEDLVRDLAYGLRALRRQPAFAAAGIGVLALAIGGITTVFSLVDAALLRPLPFTDPARLVALTHETPGTAATTLPYPLIEALRRDAKGLAATAAWGIQRVTLTGPGEPQSVRAAFVEAGMFEVLGAHPSLGRAFDVREQQAAAPLVVISHRLWQRRFGGSPEVLGATIDLDGAFNGRVRVIGVMPERFQFPDRTIPLWLPLSLERGFRDAAAQPRYGWTGVARLAPRRTPADLEAELSGIAAAAGVRPRVERVRVRLLDAGVTPRGRLTLLTLFGAVAAVLLIACTNLAALLLARGQARRRELLIRAAIGAGRARLLRQLLAESLLLAAVAGVAALLLGQWLLQLYLRFGPLDVPRLDQAQLDARALLFLSGCSLATVLLFGLLPALRATASLRLQTRDGGDEPRALRLRSGLAALQLALAVALLSAAGLLLRSFLAVRSVELGFEPQRTLVIRARLPVEDPGPRRTAYYDAALARLRAVPGVVAVGAINDLFELSEPRRFSLRAIEGREVDPAPLPLKWTSVLGDYFPAIGARVLEGRAFGERDDRTAPRVVLVDQAFARRFFPGESALGKRFKGHDARGRGDEWLEIVGVVADMRREGLERPVSAHVFESALQSGENTPDLLVRTAANPAALAPTLRAALRGVDAGASVESVATLSDQLAQQLDGRRFQSALLSLFALLALGLAALGVFGVVHYSVSRRVREVGVRMALGATREDVVLLFLGQLAGPLLAGAGLGLLGAFVVARALGALLFGITPLDPLTHAVALCSLLLVTGAACLIPALRASRLDPLLALRED
jgi:predicted permease